MRAADREERSINKLVYQCFETHFLTIFYGQVYNNNKKKNRARKLITTPDLI